MPWRTPGGIPGPAQVRTGSAVARCPAREPGMVASPDIIPNTVYLTLKTYPANRTLASSLVLARCQGVCARIKDYGPACVVDSSCRSASEDATDTCSLQPCTVMLDTDIKEEKVGRRGWSPRL
jgi:hypothetical protein